MRKLLFYVLIQCPFCAYADVDSNCEKVVDDKVSELRQLIIKLDKSTNEKVTKVLTSIKNNMTKDEFETFSQKYKKEIYAKTTKNKEIHDMPKLAREKYIKEKIFCIDKKLLSKKNIEIKDQLTKYYDYALYDAYSATLQSYDSQKPVEDGLLWPRVWIKKE